MLSIRKLSTLVIFIIAMLCASLVSCFKGFFYRIENADMDGLPVNIKRHSVSSRFRQTINVVMSRLARLSCYYIFSQPLDRVNVLPAGNIVEASEFTEITQGGVIVSDSGILFGEITADAYFPVVNANYRYPAIFRGPHSLEVITFASLVSIVLSSIGKSQVFTSIIQSIAVAVINFFFGIQIATKHSTENDAMHVFGRRSAFGLDYTLYVHRNSLRRFRRMPERIHQIGINWIHQGHVTLRQGYLDWIKHRKLFVLGFASRIVHSRPPFRFTRGQAAITALSFLRFLYCTINGTAVPFQELLCAQ